MTDHGDQSIPPCTTCQRITHFSASVIAALKNLPRATKLRKNKAICEKNDKNALARAQHDSDPIAFPDEAPDDASLITVSDAEEELLPFSMMYDTASKLTPESGKRLIRAFAAVGEKRSRDDGEGEKKGAKRMKRPEVIIKAGMAAPTVSHPLIHKLYDLDIYAPLSLFTDRTWSMSTPTPAQSSCVNSTPPPRPTNASTSSTRRRSRPPF
ncbi:hypothetical protein B0H16DRAFT_1460281 [Mycena metata]|uniref:Uncharacterized protein n=1 Tax=Mycena metata TaxID=1033252 RepID=A0AAD7N9H2_9AGAR|nr:hypothetical protein B0H16DRAFT_1460281 [Mycena metata]